MIATFNSLGACSNELVASSLSPLQFSATPRTSFSITAASGESRPSSTRPKNRESRASLALAHSCYLLDVDLATWESCRSFSSHTAPSCWLNFHLVSELNWISLIDLILAISKNLNRDLRMVIDHEMNILIFLIKTTGILDENSGSNKRLFRLK